MNALALYLLLTPAQETPAEFLKKVDEAITRGVAWLKAQQKPEGHFGESSGGRTYEPGKVGYHNKPGIAAFSLLALLKSDVPHDDPVIEKGFAFLKEYAGQRGNLITHYDRAAILMAFEALHESAQAGLMKKKGLKPSERVGDFKEPKYTPSPQNQAFISGIVRALLEEQTEKGGWRYGKPISHVGSDEDVSATQIVLFGLKSASRMKAPVDPGAVLRAMNFVLSSQEKDGPKLDRAPGFKAGDRSVYAPSGEDRARGWAYIAKGSRPEEERATGSMTSAGVGSLIIAKSILGKQLGKKASEAVDRAIYDGFAWLVQNWSVAENPGLGKPRHFYFLYGIERAGTLGLYEKLGAHWWYREGAEVLLKAQQADGRWDNGDDIPPTDVLDTCYALLFLRRGTAPVGDVMTPRVEPKK